MPLPAASTGTRPGPAGSAQETHTHLANTASLSRMSNSHTALLSFGQHAKRTGPARPYISSCSRRRRAPERGRRSQRPAQARGQAQQAHHRTHRHFGQTACQLSRSHTALLSSGQHKTRTRPARPYIPSCSSRRRAPERSRHSQRPAQARGQPQQAQHGGHDVPQQRGGLARLCRAYFGPQRAAVRGAGQQRRAQRQLKHRRR